MTPERWAKVDRVWHAVLERPESERAAAVAEYCAGDTALRHDVESLLSNLARASEAGFGGQGVGVVRELGWLVGRRVGPYDVRGVLGVGGMGEVYLAHDSTLGRHVALKILPDPWLDDPERRARFGREARLLAALNHPNIGAIYGFHDDDGVCALVLELVEGETLAERIESHAGSITGSRGLPLKEALSLARQITAALEAAHERGIAHRDFKPTNIKITPEGLVKVLDFGLAKLYGPAGPQDSPDRDDQLRPLASHSETHSGAGPHDSVESSMRMANTHDGALVGTAPYMSPEQARGRPVDKRTDVWAFGCVLYEMLTGRRAFDGEDVPSTLARILDVEPDFSVLPSGTPQAVHRLLARCLEKDRNKRLQQIAIAGFQIDEVLSTPDGLDAWPPSHRRQRLLRAAALGLAILVGAAATWFAAPRGTASIPHVTRLLMSVAPADQIGGVDGRPDRIAMAISPDGQTLVFSAVSAERRSLYLRSLDRAEATPIASTEEAVNPFFSADGRWIGYWSAGRIRKVPLAGGPPVPVTDAALLFGASWDEADRIVFSQAAGGLLEVPAAGGAPVSLTTVNREQGEVSHRLPQALPGGDTILFTVTKHRFPRWDQTHVAIYSRRTGVTRVLVEGGADARYVSTGHLVYVREGVLLAAPFDLERLELAGGAVGVVADVMQSAYPKGAARDSGAGQFVVSPTGTLVYVPGGTVPTPEGSVVSVDRAGRSETLPIAPRGFATLRLSPDEEQIALGSFGRDRDVWVYARARGTLTRLSEPGRHGVPIWSPDGERLTYASGTGGPDALRQTRADARSPSELVVADNEHSLVPAAWTPDGRRLFYYTIPTVEAAPGALWVWDADLATNSKKTPTMSAGLSAEGGGIDVSPDGQWIAYHAADSGRLEVYVQAYPGPGPRYQVSTNGGISPIWRRDGRELFYLQPSSLDDSTNSAVLSVGNIRVMTVPVTSKPALALSAPRLLFEGPYDVNVPARSYDVTADGQRFLLLKAQRRPADVITHMVVVQNWHEELQGRVPRP